MGAPVFMRFMAKRVVRTEWLRMEGFLICLIIIGFEPWRSRSDTHLLAGQQFSESSSRFFVNRLWRSRSDTFDAVMHLAIKLYWLVQPKLEGQMRDVRLSWLVGGTDKADKIFEGMMREWSPRKWELLGSSWSWPSNTGHPNKSSK